ncbi:IQ motif and SEC7 domain-containing protein 3-like [Mustela putorius furo]|uniref:IQ motif and SEC7 domain-containing protein 3-like n=1 Tax=Mustela putorius furo TaxID=9669 RepID=A0A8U0R6F9_MUSPF|nr:IQ motif and SEC7 domain-containing protein 3-like [Mustela putorius furo]
MASAAETPGKAAEYLQELTRIVAAQQELLARRRRRIEELERQVARLSRENAGLLERHRRHLAACARRPDPGPQPLGVIPELGSRRDKSEGESSRSVRYVFISLHLCVWVRGEGGFQKPCALISL